jgi:NDP-sugar pyrophosphorylase family protein/aminoglycoside/choline kinase family phosphotransferase
MRAPRKAVLLAAGLGTRMRPLSLDLPKPLMPLWNRPLLYRLLDLMRGWGVREVLINLHHRADAVVEALRADPPGGLRVALSFEPEILGTGGALARAAWFVDGDPFWIANTDIAAARLSPRPFLRLYQARQPVAVLWLHPTRGPRTVEMHGGDVTCFASRRAGAPGTYTFCGLQLASPALLDFVPPRGFSSLVDAWRAAREAGRAVAGVAPRGADWADLGSPETYLAAHAARAPGHPDGPGAAAGDGFAAVAPDARVARGAVLRDSVVWSGARIRGGAVLENAVAGRGVEVRGRLRGPAVRAAACRDDPVVQAALRGVGFDAERTVLQPLPPRGSARTFTRLVCGRQRAMLIRYGLERPENALYTPHARFLARHGVAVPGILADDPRMQWTVVEDLGDSSLLEAARDVSARRREQLYGRTLEAAARLHALRARPPRLEPAFTPSLYRWERGLLDAHVLAERCEAGERAAILGELAGVARRLARLPRVLVHRDLQASNVLLARGRPVLIDFQGLREGPAAYDLASLLCDPYVMLPLRLQQRLVARYLELTRDHATAAMFWTAAIQRLAQALGAFGRLGRLPGMGRFAEHVPDGLAMLGRAVEQSGLDLPHLASLCGRPAAVLRRRRRRKAGRGRSIPSDPLSSCGPAVSARPRSGRVQVARRRER